MNSRPMTSNVIRFPAARSAARRNTTTTPAPVVRLKNSKPAATAPWAIADVWQALSENRLTVHYQPQYNMQTNRTEAVEALVRLVDCDGHLVYPDRFIEAAEMDGVIVPLGRAVIEQACADFSGWRRDGANLRHVSINLSAHQLTLDRTLVRFIESTLKAHDLTWTDLEFELTERQPLASGDPGAKTLVDLAHRGSRIVIDDFGVGYGSLLYLMELPVSAFKLDRALVSRMADDPGVTRIVEHLLRIAKDQGVDVVGEGIETMAQQNALVNSGCTHGQGFGFARPMDVESIRGFLQHNRGAMHM